MTNQLQQYRFTPMGYRRYAVEGPRGFRGLLVRSAAEHRLLFLVVPARDGESHAGRGVTTTRIAGFQWFTDARGMVEGYS